MEEKKYVYMTATRCFTYNHAPYIREALQGFVMQDTDFPAVYIVVDDASTDDEPRILKEWVDDNLHEFEKSSLWNEMPYGQLAVGNLNNKSNSTFVVLLLAENHTQNGKGRKKRDYIASWQENAKYTALCEGDDFWIDPLKLQKQVEFMEAHPEHSLCFCAHKELFHSGVTADVLRYETNKEECPMHDMIMEGGGFMATNSMLYRKSMYESYTVWAKGCPIGDLPLMLTLAQKGKVGYLVDIMCVYRKLANGSWSQLTSSNIKKSHEHHLSIIEMWKRFDKYSNYNYHYDIVKKIENNRKRHYKKLIRLFLCKIKNKLCNSKTK